MKPSSLLFLLLLPLPWLAEPAIATVQPPISWTRLLPACAPTGAVACGNNRSYFFGALPNQALNCGSPQTQTEQVRLYPSKSADSWGGNFPCSDGSCLSDIDVDKPWVALIDWKNEHGLTVAETLSRVSALPVHLFELDEKARPTLGNAVGDAHVLIQLCAIAEYAKASAPPTVVNLSFGRYWPQSAQQSPGPSLEKEITSLIAELATQTHFVAAAGNDGLMLFPAGIPEVLSVGALDLAAFRKGKVAPSRISPKGADAFFPANGILLEQGNLAWPLAPGTSYASALAAGWIATLPPEERDLIFAANEDVLAPRKVGIPSRYELFLGSRNLRNSANKDASRLVEIAALPATDAWLKLGQQTGPGQLEWIEFQTGGIPKKTWTEVRGQANSPAPDSYPCVPCADAPDPWGAGQALTHDSLLLHLGSGEKFGRELVLEGLYLQSGERILGFDSSKEADFLEEVARGDLEQLEFKGLPADVRDHELLLVWVFKESGNSFVRKTPITRVIWPDF